MRRIALYLLSLLCGVLFVVSVIAGDSWPGLAVACFITFIVALLTDKQLGTEG
jgi:hypothetical protein